MGPVLPSPLLTWFPSLTTAALMPGQPRYRKWYCVVSLAAVVLARTLNLQSPFPYNKVMTNQWETQCFLEKKAEWD